MPVSTKESSRPFIPHWNEMAFTTVQGKTSQCNDTTMSHSELINCCYYLTPSYPPPIGRCRKSKLIEINWSNTCCHSPANLSEKEKWENYTFSFNHPWFEGCWHQKSLLICLLSEEKQQSVSNWTPSVPYWVWKCFFCLESCQVSGSVHPD